METNRKDRDIVRVEIDMGHISFVEYSNIGYNGNSVVGGYRLTNSGVKGLMNGW